MSCDEVVERFQWFSKDYNIDHIKNRPRHVLVSEILKLHSDLDFLMDEYFQEVRNGNKPTA